MKLSKYENVKCKTFNKDGRSFNNRERLRAVSQPLVYNFYTSSTRQCYKSVIPADVVSLVKALPDKQCASDPLPTWLSRNVFMSSVPVPLVQLVA